MDSALEGADGKGTQGNRKAGKPSRKIPAGPRTPAKLDYLRELIDLFQFGKEKMDVEEIIGV